MSPVFNNRTFFNPDLELLSEIKLDHEMDLSSFSCEDDDLNDFLINDAYVSFIERLSVTYLLLHDIEIIGFYSLCNDCILRKLLPGDDALEGRDYKTYPAIKLARLARKSSCKSKGIGFELFIRALEKSNEISEISGCRFLTVDAYNIPKILSFYEDLGFKSVKKVNLGHNTVNMYFDFINACNP